MTLLSSDTPSPGMRVLLWAVLTAAVTLSQIQYSASFGRLASLPYYDDVAYMQDGLNRLHIFRTDGLRGLMENYLEYPPHTPFAWLMGIIAFGLFGAHDWAPYVLNGTIVFFFLAMVDFLCAGIALWKRVLIYIAAASVPVVGVSVSEFRPDMASALCVASGAIVLLSGPLTGMPLRRRICAGVLLGLGMLFKPAVFPMTVAISGAAMLLATFIDIVLTRPDAKRLARAWLHVAAPAIAVFGWHYAIDFAHIWNYALGGVRGWATEHWDVREPLAWHWTYWLWGFGMETMIGQHLRLGGSILLLGVIGAIVLHRKGEREPLARLAGLIGVIVVAYLVPTLVKMKTPYIGAPYAYLLVLTGVAVFAQIVLRLGHRERALAAMIVVALCVLSLLCFRFPAKIYEPGNPQLIARQKTVLGVYEALRKAGVGPDDPIYLSTTGYVNGEVLNYLSWRDARHGLLILESPFSDQFDTTPEKPGHQDLFEESNWAIVSEPGNSEAHDGPIFWSGNIQDKTLEMVRAHPQFELMAEIPTYSGRRYFVFQRVKNLWGYTPENGFGPREGPYPQWQFYEPVQWAFGPRAALRLNHTTGGRLRMYLDARPYHQNIKADILLDGHKIDTLTFPLGVFETREITFDIEPGTHRIEFLFDRWNQDDPQKPEALLFRKLQFQPVRPSTPLPPSGRAFRR